jgi:hypothetical protein
MKLLIKHIDKAENLIRSGGHQGTTSVNICEYIETIPLLRGDDVAPDTVIRIATVSREWLEGGVHGVMVLDIPDSHLKVDQKNVERIAELEKERDKLKFANTEAKEYIESELGSVFITVCPSEPFNPKVHQAKRDLEQQVKGAENIIDSVLGEPESLTSECLSIRYEFLDRLKQLREQAKQLKGGAE